LKDQGKDCSERLGSGIFFSRTVCLTRGDELKVDAEEILSVIIDDREGCREVIKEISNPNEIKRTLRVTLGPWGELCLHEYRWNPARILLSPFRLSRAERIWKFYDDLPKKQFTVPAPVLFLDVKTGVFSRRTYLATRWIRNGMALSHIALKRHSAADSCDLFGVLLKCVDAIADLHAGGFVHGDLKWSNLLFVPDQYPDITLIDLDAIRKTFSRSLQYKDFARFLIPPREYDLADDQIESMIGLYVKRRKISRDSVEPVIAAYLAKKKR
jgi:serine/threonine protein kinase